MDPFVLPLIVLCVLLLIVILVLIAPDDRQLAGFWEADDIFKEESGLSTAYMYVGCKSDEGAYPSYILFVNERGDVILNRSMNTVLKYSKYRKNWKWDTDLPKNDILPPNMTMEYDQIDGTILLYNGNTLYAKFIKNNKLSHLCKPEVRTQLDIEMNDDSNKVNNEADEIDLNESV